MYGQKENNMKNELQYRQGDVGFIPIPQTDLTQAVRRESLVIAEGEVTGHKHQVLDVEGAELYDLGERMVLRVTAETGISIVHEEHAPVQVPAGDYEIRIAQEYTPTEIRNVAD
jgi:hypothetical protein